MSTKIPDSRTNDPSPTDDPGQVTVPGPVADPEAGPGTTILEPAVLPRTEEEDERHRKVEWFNDRRTELLPQEKAWMERYDTLLGQGFQLRPRLRPGWQPSWAGPGGNATQCEDGEILRCKADAVDATRISDGKLVWIKRIFAGREEMQIFQRLSYPTSPLARDVENPSVPIFHMFVDPNDDNYSFVVMPFLRAVNDPPFNHTGEVCDFIDQILEGLVYLHEHDVVHGDINRRHFLMDASKMYPDGFHPIQRDLLPDYSRVVKPLPRSEAIPKYYYTSFDVSVLISSDVVGVDPIEPQATPSGASPPPELAAFKVDISAMGALLEKEFFERFANFEFLWPLIHSMVKGSPDGVLPTAPEVMEKWASIKGEISAEDRKRPLHFRGDRPLEDGGYVIDVMAIVRVIIHFARSLLSPIIG